MRRAIRLGELRKLGVKRENALIVQAYIEWGHCDFDRVRDAFEGEWAKWSAQLNRHQTTFIKNVAFSEISATKLRAISNQSGPLGYRLKGNQFEQSPEFYAVFSEYARTSNFDLSYVQRLLTKGLSQISPEFAGLLPDSLVATIAKSISGISGSPDEIEDSGLDAIRTANEREFRIARFVVRQIFRELGNGKRIGEFASRKIEIHQLWQTLQLLRPQISTAPWVIFGFVQILKFGLKDLRQI
jgi:hypothetical protein